MLLEEIKANISSDEDGSSDDEPEEEKKRIGKQSEEMPGDEGELPTEKLPCWIYSIFPQPFNL